MAIVETIYDERWAILLGLALIYLARSLYVYHRLSAFQGPFGVGFSELPHSRRLFSMMMASWYEEVADKYGPIARIGPNSLITSHPDVWTHIHLKPGYKRSDWFYQAARWEYGKDTVFSQTDNAMHDLRRKQLAPGYSGRENIELESSVDRNVQSFLDLLRSKYLSDEKRVIPMDLSAKAQYLTLDVISTIGFGRPFGMLESDTDVNGIIQSSEEALVLGNFLMAIGLGGLRLKPIIGPFLYANPLDKTGFGRMLGLCYEWADARWAQRASDKRQDMLASFIRHGLNKDELKTEAVQQIIAGSDTTAGALRGLFLYIMANHRVYAKLQREIDDAIAQGKAPPASSESSIASYAALKQLPYLQAVIREAMRVWPPVVNLFPHDVPPGGDTVVVDGKPYFLPGGAEIGHSVRSMQRCKAIFGDDADAFRPERWLSEEGKADDEAEKERLARMAKTNDLIFSYGRWQCLGKAVAQMELAKTIFETFRNFDIATLKPPSPWKTQTPLGLFVISDMWVQVTAR
jgi:cytochrome P450